MARGRGAGGRGRGGRGHAGLAGNDRGTLLATRASPPPETVAMPVLTEAVPETTMRFADLAPLGCLEPQLLRTITDDLGYDHMMPVQEATLSELLGRKIDCLAQAKTGTGKTIAFLLPAIQNMIGAGRDGRGISLLVVSPTRELAMQIAAEARLLLQRFPAYKVRVAIGGTNKASEETAIRSRCDVLIGTPGRLADHLGGGAGIGGLLQRLDTLVLDEADRLLDMGFKDQIVRILGFLPARTAVPRQGMLFSATITPDVRRFAHLVLNDEHKFISTIRADEAPTHERVPQLLVSVPAFADLLPTLAAVLADECRLQGAASFKAIVFAQTSQSANLFGHVLAELGGLPAVSVLHSRLSQGARTRVTNDFRTASAAVLVATDVVARGMDFPNVSGVVQVGVPMDRESYIHRLGRTARAGKEGRSLLLLTHEEGYFATAVLRDVALLATPVPAAAVAERAPAVRRVVADMQPDARAKVYQAWLGYYKAHAGRLRWDAATLVARVNRFALDGLLTGEVPALERSTVGKMGLRGAPGLNIVANRARPAGHRGR